MLTGNVIRDRESLFLSRLIALTGTSLVVDQSQEPLTTYVETRRRSPAQSLAVSRLAANVRGHAEGRCREAANVLLAVTTDAGLGCRISNRSSASIATRRWSQDAEPHQPIRPSGALRHDRRERRRPAVRSHLPVVVNPRSVLWIVLATSSAHARRMCSRSSISVCRAIAPCDFDSANTVEPASRIPASCTTRASTLCGDTPCRAHGRRRIGVIGVDFTDHHFFVETGRQLR